MNSLRHKITASYVAIAALVVVLSVLSLLELRLLEEKIVAGERISEFFDVTLEIRRFEKNHFLYRQAADLAENRRYVAQAAAMLREHRALFETLDEPGRIADLDDALARYGGLMARHSAADADPLAEGEIRQVGKEIVTVAESLARTERKTLQALLERQRRILIGTVIAVGLLVLAISQLLWRRVGRPLKEMEQKMEAVAAGRLAKLDMATGDREIASLTQAFNHVLQELDVRQGQLVMSEKLASLGTLLSGVAHELNNPLSNIATSCEILGEEIAGHDLPYKRELLAQILDETWRARRIVRSLLDYARDREFRRERLPLLGLVEDTLRLIRGQIPAQVAVAVDIDAQLQVAGDKQRLQQVLLNLVRNGIEAVAGAGEVRIAARLAPLACAPRPGLRVFGHCGNHGEAVEIEIRDNGHGIAPEVLPRIFDPFFTTKDVGKGVGLGLFIAFEIVEEHGGCIAVESEPGRGTAFLVRLPAGEDHD